jgi:hypothetical protein
MSGGFALRLPWTSMPGDTRIKSGYDGKGEKTVDFRPAADDGREMKTVKFSSS